MGQVWPPPQRQTLSSISKILFPAAQLHHLSNRLPRQRNGIAFAANSHEHVRKRHGRAAQFDVACFVARMGLLSANAACRRCYVAFMPWCLHNLSPCPSFAALLLCPSARWTWRHYEWFVDWCRFRPFLPNHYKADTRLTRATLHSSARRCCLLNPCNQRATDRDQALAQ